MESIVVKPEKEQKALWLIGWGIPFVLGLAPGLVLTLALHYPGNLIAGLCVVGWLIITVPISLWITPFYRSLEYVIDSDSVRAKRGVFWRKRVSVPYTKITNVDVTQGPFERMCDIGRIHVQTAGAAGPQGTHAELKLVGLRDLARLKEAIMERIRGRAVSRPEKAKEEGAEETDRQLLRRMLAELTAIREALEGGGA